MKKQLLTVALLLSTSAALQASSINYIDGRRVTSGPAEDPNHNIMMESFIPEIRYPNGKYAFGLSVDQREHEELLDNVQEILKIVRELRDKK